MDGGVVVVLVVVVVKIFALGGFWLTGLVSQKTAVALSN